MTHTAILMGLPPGDRPATGGAVVAFVLIVLLVGFSSVLVAYVKQWRKSRALGVRAFPCGSGWLWGWAAVLLANLVVPLWFGSSVTANCGQMGMCLGILVVWLLGHFIVARLNRLRGPLVVGGVVVALSQYILIGHIVAGLIAMSAVNQVAEGPMTNARAFAVTLLTAAQLAVAALAFGLPLCLWYHTFDGRIHAN